MMKSGYLIVVALVLAALNIPLFGQCPHPNLPSPTPAPIDSTTCGPAGNGGAETTQNEAKNNFCADGPAQPITIAEMTTLQQKVESDKSIPFGSRDEHPLTTNPGPATDRKPLQQLGEGNQVVLVGFVKKARQEEAESVNCGKGGPVPNKPEYHDIHVSIVENSANSECSGIVAEMIPHHRPTIWTADLVNQVATAGLQVRVTGQLMFDSSHSPCQNGKPVCTKPKGNPPKQSCDPARVSLWEIHPIYKFEVCTHGDCSSGSGWVPLDQWRSLASKSKKKKHSKTA